MKPLPAIALFLALATALSAAAWPAAAKTAQVQVYRGVPRLGIAVTPPPGLPLSAERLEGPLVDRVQLWLQAAREKAREKDAVLNIPVAALPPAQLRAQDGLAILIDLRWEERALESEDGRSAPVHRGLTFDRRVLLISHDDKGVHEQETESGPCRCFIPVDAAADLANPAVLAELADAIDGQLTKAVKPTIRQLAYPYFPKHTGRWK